VPARVGLLSFRDVTRAARRAYPMEALTVSALAVAIAELGDKTHLLALLLAVRYRRAAPVIAGILIATLVLAWLAATVGAAAATALTGPWFRWLVAGSFIAIGIWTLLPQHEERQSIRHAGGAVTTSAVTFFIAEMADKTQLATVALAASFGEVLTVAAGATIGMMAVNAPTVWLGARFSAALPLRAIRIAAALTFIALGVWVLLS
jgi:Ca2+/H+ antiporter, TMEM165/GDT1 family